MNANRIQHYLARARQVRSLRMRRRLCLGLPLPLGSDSMDAHLNARQTRTLAIWREIADHRAARKAA